MSRKVLTHIIGYSTSTVSQSAIKAITGTAIWTGYRKAPSRADSYDNDDEDEDDDNDDDDDGDEDNEDDR